MARLGNITLTHHARDAEAAWARMVTPNARPGPGGPTGGSAAPSPPASILRTSSRPLSRVGPDARVWFKDLSSYFDLPSSALLSSSSSHPEPVEDRHQPQPPPRRQLQKGDYTRTKDLPNLAVPEHPDPERVVKAKCPGYYKPHEDLSRPKSYRTDNMSAREMMHMLTRPAVLQILRAAGFHSARPSVIEALTDIMAKHLLLLANRTAAHAYGNHNDVVPTITDVRMAMDDAGCFTTTMTASEEAWVEAMRKPIGNGKGAEKERERRMEEDTREIQEFINWVQGDVNREIMRIAGTLKSDDPRELDGEKERLDYLTALKRKHSKTGDQSRFQGTVLGIDAEDRDVLIEGGPVSSLEEWQSMIRQRNRKSPAVPSSPTSLAERPDEIMTDEG